MAALPLKAVQEIVRRRMELRERLWPGAEQYIWSRKNEDGFTTIPRTLSLICTLLRDLGKGDPSRAYLELWTRSFDDAVVEITDEEEVAVCCGYTSGGRNVRSWRDHLRTLERLGFIKTARRGTRKYGYVLLLHPHDAVQRLHASKALRAHDWWWSLFLERLEKTGARLRLKKGRVDG